MGGASGCTAGAVVATFLLGGAWGTTFLEAEEYDDMAALVCLVITMDEDKREQKGEGEKCFKTLF